MVCGLVVKGCFWLLYALRRYRRESRMRTRRHRWRIARRRRRGRGVRFVGIIVRLMIERVRTDWNGKEKCVLI